MRASKLLIGAALLFGGCASYTWTSSVPEKLNTISVSVFRNESDVTELGNVATTQIGREIQREGSFKIASGEDAALEIQGVITSADAGSGFGSRKTMMRNSEFKMKMEAVVSVIDHVNGKVIIDNRKYKSEATFVIYSDIQTGLRNASGRACEDLARQVVDDLVAYDWAASNSAQDGDWGSDKKEHKK